MDMLKNLCQVLKLPDPSTSMHVSIHEDNAGALVLAETLPPQFTPRSKHYAIKTIWFREEIVKRGIKLLKIDTKAVILFALIRISNFCGTYLLSLM